MVMWSTGGRRPGSEHSPGVAWTQAGAHTLLLHSEAGDGDHGQAPVVDLLGLELSLGGGVGGQQAQGVEAQLAGVVLRPDLLRCGGAQGGPALGDALRLQDADEQDDELPELAGAEQRSSGQQPSRRQREAWGHPVALTRALPLRTRRNKSASPPARNARTPTRGPPPGLAPRAQATRVLKANCNGAQSFWWPAQLSAAYLGQNRLDFLGRERGVVTSASVRRRGDMRPGR